jgi:predicted acetyltransferase
MIKISICKKPDRKITQTVLYFQFRFVEWSKDDMEFQDDQYGSLPYAYVLAYDNDKLVGVINLIKRKINFKKTEVLLGGVGGVCVHSDYRRKGIAKKLLVKAMENLKTTGVDVAYLCTDVDKLGDLYKIVGFKPINRPYVATGLSGKKYEDTGGMLANVNSDEKFKLIMEDADKFDLQGQDW